jgi:hypothetical protein
MERVVAVVAQRHLVLALHTLSSSLAISHHKTSEDIEVKILPLHTDDS